MRLDHELQIHFEKDGLTPSVPTLSVAALSVPALSVAPEGEVSGPDKLGEMPEWNLGDLYPSKDSDELKADIETATREARDLATDFQGKIIEAARDGGRLADGVKRFEVLQDRLGRIASFAGLLYSADTSDPERSKFYGDCQEKLTDITSYILFFPLEINKIPDDVLEAALAHTELSRYRPWFDDLRAEKPYQLDDDLERLFHDKSVTGRGAWNRLFNETMTSLRFEVDGEQYAIEPALNFLSSRDEKKRRAGSDALAKVFSENVRLFTLITNTLAKDKEISDRWRRFDDVAASRHLANRVEGEVVDALVATVRDHYASISHRYYALKAKWFGMDALAHWDRNAPLPKQPERKFTWAEAQRTVLDAYSDFSPEMSGIAARFFDNSWIDAPVREGKAPGAFSHPTVPSAHPYIMLNYQGRPRDVMTLAHELGHGVHQVLANGQGPLMAPTPLTLAETASVFGEMLTFKALLKKTTDLSARKALLASKVEDMINTVVRQIAFYTFERQVHEARREGELTSDQINKIWLDVQSESLGPAVTLGEGYEYFWCYVPHFIHSPFYVYAYAFGECLVNSLYAVFENSQEGFSERYLDMLRAGGSKHHSELLAPFGLDATSPDFWARGLGVISALIDELEAMEN